MYIIEYLSSFSSNFIKFAAFFIGNVIDCAMRS